MDSTKDASSSIDPQRASPLQKTSISPITILMCSIPNYQKTKRYVTVYQRQLVGHTQDAHRLMSIITETTSNENQKEGTNCLIPCPTPEHLTSSNDPRLREVACARGRGDLCQKSLCNQESQFTQITNRLLLSQSHYLKNPP